MKSKPGAGGVAPSAAAASPASSAQPVLVYSRLEQAALKRSCAGGEGGGRVKDQLVAETRLRHPYPELVAAAIEEEEGLVDRPLEYAVKQCPPSGCWEGGV